MNNDNSKEPKDKNTRWVSGTERPPYRAVAENVLRSYHPKARCGFISGSITRGDDTATSDIDLVVLYDTDFTDVHRNTITHQGWLVELFVHNEQAQDYYFDKDIKNGRGTMVEVVATSIPIGPDMDFARKRRDRAEILYAQGPAEWNTKEIDRQRYAISSTLDDLADPRPVFEQYAILARLLIDMGEFIFGTKRVWRGTGKHLARRLTAECPDLAREFEEAWRAGHNGDMDKVIALGHKILGPFGGYLQAGYRSAAPQDWQNFKTHIM